MDIFPIPVHSNPRTICKVAMGRNLTERLQREPEAGQTAEGRREELHQETKQEIVLGLRVEDKWTVRQA